MCECCQQARARPDPGSYRMHNEGCIHCGARAIQRIQRLFAIGTDAKRERSRSTLAVWMAMGHDEARLRALAKAPEWALEPLHTVSHCASVPSAAGASTREASGRKRARPNAG